MEKNSRVLLVDDNLGMLETLSDILESHGLKVDTATNGQEATQKFQVQSYDVAVVDIVLPGISGLELIRKLRPDHPDTRFIVITAYTDTKLAREAHEENVVGVLYKPLDPDKLVTMVKGLVNG